MVSGLVVLEVLEVLVGGICSEGGGGGGRGRREVQGGSAGATEEGGGRGGVEVGVSGGGAGHRGVLHDEEVGGGRKIKR